MTVAEFFRFLFGHDSSRLLAVRLAEAYQTRVAVAEQLSRAGRST
jgi:hypothetical protein